MLELKGFYLTIEASATYSVDAPTLQVLVDGAVVASRTLTGSVASYSFLLDFPVTDSFPGR